MIKGITLFPRVIILALFFLIGSTSIYGQNLSFQGNVNSHLVYGKIDQQPVIDIMGELKVKVDWGTMDYQLYLDISALAGKVDLNPFVPHFSGAGLQLNQLYWQAWLDQGELKAGKQRIAWGSGYFYNPTDLINPIDLYASELKRENTTCFYGSYFLDQGTLEGVLMADFQPVGPSSNQEADLYAKMLNPEYTGIVEMPVGWQEEWEAAIRYSAMVGDFDTSFIYYHGREDIPINAINLTTGQVVFSYPCKDTLGLSFSGTVQPGTEESIGLWGEAAYSFWPSKKGYMQLLLGVDYTFDNGLHILTEYYYDGSYSLFLGQAGEALCAHLLALETDTYLTDLFQIRAEMISPLDLSGQVLAVEGNYMLNDQMEINLGMIQLIQPEGSVFDPGLGFSFFRDQIYIGLKYYF